MPLVVNLIIIIIMGAITAAIASSKGRNAVGWFFVGFLLGLIGVIIICCMSNLKEQREHRKWTERERRRLREQLAQERIKNEAFRQHTTARLDSHDTELGVDTRSANVLPGGQPAGALTSTPVAPQLSDQGNQVAVWHYEVNGQPVGPISEGSLAQMVIEKKLTSTSLVWKEGLADWKRVGEIPQFGRHC
jgi:hypothetical protein